MNKIHKVSTQFYPHQQSKILEVLSKVQHDLKVEDRRNQKLLNTHQRREFLSNVNLREIKKNKEK